MSAKQKLTPVAHFFARFGCFAIGSVYILIGVWAMFALLRVANPAADEERILQRLLSFPLGGLWIAAIVLGTVAYNLWLLFEAVFDPYELGSTPNGLTERVGIGLSAFGYAIIVYSGVKVLVGSGGTGEQKQQLLVSEILGWPAGEWLIGSAGLLLALAGLYQIKYVYTGNHQRRLLMDGRSKITRVIVNVLAWTGYFARCAILLVLGWFFLSAAWSSDPAEVGDTDSAFDFLGLGGGALGDTVFSAVALGTVAYGLFLWINGVCFRFSDERPRGAPRDGGPSGV